MRKFGAADIRAWPEIANQSWCARPPRRIGIKVRPRNSRSAQSRNRSIRSRQEKWMPEHAEEWLSEGDNDCHGAKGAPAEALLL